MDDLPIWADYRPVEGLCGTAWCGAEYLVIDPATGECIREDIETFFGGCVLTSRRAFQVANGYANPDFLKYDVLTTVTLPPPAELERSMKMTKITVAFPCP